MAIRTGIRTASLAALAFISASAALADDDSGVHAFLSSIFGQAGQPAQSQSASPIREPTFRPAGRHRFAGARPVTIRRSAPRIVAGVGPAKPGRVSIFTDGTLRPGDAVMMADGIRVFVGSRSWPYTKADFVSLDQAHDLSRDSRKVLAGLNTPPRT